MPSPTPRTTFPRVEVIASIHVRVVVYPGSNEEDGRTENERDGHLEAGDEERDDNAQVGSKTLRVLSVYLVTSAARKSQRTRIRTVAKPIHRSSQRAG